MLPDKSGEEELDHMDTVITRKWYSTAEVAEMLGYGLTKTKFLVISGQIRSVKDGGHRKILPEWIDDYIRRVIEEQAA
jgi:excisionase family DNA binding protein